LPALPAIEALRGLVATVRIEEPVRAYVVAIANASRIHPELAVGISPRGVEQMGEASRARALLDGREFVLPDDVKALVDPVFSHRLVPTTDARIRDRTAGEILREIMGSVPVPVEGT
jgi:MoxR-like ATPase